jgi:hypothetical protein
MNPNLPVGVFDSGFGGLTVYRALHEELPRERFLNTTGTAKWRLLEERARERRLCDHLDHFYVTGAEQRFARRLAIFGQRADAP